MIRPRHILSGALVLLTLFSTGVRAQRVEDPDSLMRLLSSADWEARFTAIANLNQLPAEDLPPGYADQVISLLEKEAVDRAVEGPHEGYGEYEISLTDAVLRLRDPRSLRGMALLGIRTSGDAQDFVASFGGEALSHLEEAWRRDYPDRSPVIHTLGRMLADYPDQLSEHEEVVARRRIFRAFDDLGLVGAGVWSAERASLVGAVPLLEAIGDTIFLDITRENAQEAAEALRPIRSSMSPVELAEEAGRWLRAFCLEPSGARVGACRSLENLWADARGHLAAGRSRPARNVLNAFARRVDQAHERGVLTDPERSLLVGNAHSIRERL